MTASPPNETVSAGLKKVLSDAPVHSGYVEAGAAVTRLRGPEAWAEAGYKPFQSFGAFARGTVDSHDAGAMVGVRWEF